MILTRRQKIGAGVVAGTLALILLIIVIYFGFIKKDTPKPKPTPTPTPPKTTPPKTTPPKTTPPTTNPPKTTRCANADMCNPVLYYWMVTKKWLFNNSANGAFKECAGCENISFAYEKRNLTPITSKDGGTTWTAHKDEITAYNQVKQ